MVERSLCMREVVGSIPTSSTFFAYGVYILAPLLRHLTFLHSVGRKISNCCPTSCPLPPCPAPRLTESGSATTSVHGKRRSRGHLMLYEAYGPQRCRNPPTLIHTLPPLVGPVRSLTAPRLPMRLTQWTLHVSRMPLSVLP